MYVEEKVICNEAMIEEDSFGFPCDVHWKVSILEPGREVGGCGEVYLRLFKCHNLAHSAS